MKRASKSSLDKTVPQKKGGKVNNLRGSRAKENAMKTFETVRSTEEENNAKLYTERNNAEEVLDRHRSRLMDLPMINGVHVGYRRKNDQIVFPLQVCIRVHLSVCKYPKGDPRIAHPIEEEIEGIPVDILTRRYTIIGNPTSGDLPSANTVAASANANNDTSNPIIGGVSLSSTGSTQFGTLGLPAFQGSKQVFVTNMHVVGDASGVTIHQPGNASSAIIGEVSRTRPPVRSPFIDAAIIDSNFSRPAKIKLSNLAGGSRAERLVAGSPITSIPAFKIGARTVAEVLGRIQSVSASIFVEGFGNMHNQIIVTPIDTSQTIIRHGDSGAVLVQKLNATTLQIIGLCHALGSDGSLIACHWSSVETQFNIRLFKF